MAGIQYMALHQPLEPDKPGCIMSCQGGETDFSHPFLWIFLLDPRILQLTIELQGQLYGAAPVKHPHKPTIIKL